jgi:site-specific recombinase XerD
MTTDNPIRFLPFAEALALYRAQFLAARNLAERTRREYLWDLTRLVAFLTDTCQLATVDQVERKHLEGYLAELDRRGWKGSSRRRSIASIRSLFAFLTDQGLIPRSPAEQLIPPEREHDQPRVLTQAEYKRLKEAVAYEVRDAAIIELLLQTGLRVSELARLRLGDVDIPPKIVRPNKARNDPGTVGAVHVQGKGRKARTVTLNWKACKALKAYRDVRPDIEEDGFFVTKFGRPMGVRAIQDVVEKYLTEAGIPDASVHTLRHTFATQMVKDGAKLPAIQKALGHADLKTTSLYIDLAREVMDQELQEHAL